MLTEQEEVKVKSIIDAFDGGKSITELTPTTTLGDADIMEVTQGGESKKVPVSVVKSVVNADVLTDINKRGVFNVTVSVPLNAGSYYTLSTAIAAVPTASKTLGLDLKFSTGANVWVVYRYKGTDLAGWITESNWEQVPDAAKLTSIETNLNKKVDEVTGKGLSTNDYTTIEKNKVANLPDDTNAQLAQLIKQTYLLNKILNGNFADTSAWTKHVNSTFTVLDNVATLIPTFSTDGIKQGSVIAAHKYYFKADIKTTNATVRIAFPGVSVFATGDNAYHKIVAYGTASATTAINAFTIIDNASSGHVPIYIKKAIAVDLTAMFGAGSEPTLLEFEEMLSSFPDYWFDGEVNLFSTDELFLPLNQKIDEQDAAINARIDEKDIVITQELADGDFNNPAYVFSGVTNFRLTNATVPVVADSILKFTATAQEGRVVSPNLVHEANHYYYVFAKVKSKSNKVGLMYRTGGANNAVVDGAHSGSGEFEILHGIVMRTIALADFTVGVFDKRASAWDEIQVDYIGYIDLTDSFNGNETEMKNHVDYAISKEGFGLKYIVTKPKYLLDAMRKSNTNFYIPTGASAYNGVGTETNAEDITTSVLYAMWDKLIAEYPTLLTKSTLGVDASGLYNIHRIKFKPLGAKSKLLVTANIHGNGTTGDPQDAGLALYEFIKDILANYESSKQLEFLRYNVEIDMIPCGNPWGYNNKTRENSNTVDINRDFDSLTPQAETTIIKNWMASNTDAKLYLDIHAAGSTATIYGLTAFMASATSTASTALKEAGEYVAKVQKCVFTPHLSSEGMSLTHAEKVLGIPAILTEFAVYATGRETHGAEMMTNYVEWIGNVLLRGAAQVNSVNERIVLTTPDGTKKYKISIDNNGVLSTTLV